MQSLGPAPALPMHEEVFSNLHGKPLFSARRPSIAGQGLPERMRSTVFAFMGLTAAGGLTLVAIFAQMSFPLLSPAPLPSDPSRANAVAEAEVVTAGHGLETAVPAGRTGGEVGGRQANAGAAGGGFSGGSRNTAAAPSTPATPVEEPTGTGGAGAPPSAAPTPAPSPAPTPASTPAPAPSPAPVAPSTPEPAPPQPAPPAAAAAAPGNSSSSAAAEHASDRGIEASSSANGKALGHEK
jgi:hypothetical protein